MGVSLRSARRRKRRLSESFASRFHPVSPGVWVWKLAKPLAALPNGTLTVSVADKQGNVIRIERRFRVGN